MVGLVKKTCLAKIRKLAPIIEELLSEGYNLKLTVTGNSMYPFLRHGVDSVELICNENRRIIEGDIILIKRINNQYVLHRVVKVSKKNTLFLAGDAQKFVEGPIMREQIIAVVFKVYRREKEINCDSFSWKVLSVIWRKLLPVRPIIINWLQKV